MASTAANVIPPPEQDDTDLYPDTPPNVELAPGDPWPEIVAARTAKRHELVLSGADISRRITFTPDRSLPKELFAIWHLNYLDITRTSLETLDERLGDLENLQNLVLRENKLKALPESIGKLKKLKILDVSNNSLTSLPCTLYSLPSLDSLRVSNNQLSSFPLPPQATQNEPTPPGLPVPASRSKPTPPPLLCSLHILDLSHNALTTFPEGLCWSPSEEKTSGKGPASSATNSSAVGPGTIMVDTVLLSHNQIVSVPTTIERLPVLKILDLEFNALKELPVELLSCVRLKELRLRGNPLRDRRLTKLANDQKMSTKQIVDYLAVSLSNKSHRSKGKSVGSESEDIEAASSALSRTSITEQESDQTKEAEEKDDAASDNEETNNDEHKSEISSASQATAARRKKKRTTASETASTNSINIVPPSGKVEVKITAAVASVRPYLACCIVTGIDLAVPDIFKKFFTLQTKLHEGICEKRQLATIATHDLAHIRSPLQYDARKPEKTLLLPLGKKEEQSARDLLRDMHLEADAYRKQHKRNTTSGVHKYLDLLKGKQVFPFLVDSGNAVISFPPITNCESTRITRTTQSFLVEISSSTSLDACRKVADEFLARLLELAAQHTASSSSPEAQPASEGHAAADAPSPNGQASGDQKLANASVAATPVQLLVEQVRVLAEDGSLRTVYPSRADLPEHGTRYLVNRED